MRKTVSNILKKHKLMRKIFRFVIYAIGKIKYSYYKYTNKVDNKLVVFESYQGRNYSCNPKAIYLAMKKDDRFRNYKYVWCFNDINKQMNETKVKTKSKEYYKIYAKAKYVIVNALIEEFITPKKNQIFVQCWHGTPLKKLRCDIKFESIFNDKMEIKKRNDLDVKRYKYFLSPSKYCTHIFKQAFNIKNKNIIIEIGYPRNDFLYNFKARDIIQIKKELNLPNNKKIILYAPTFRDNNHISGKGYSFELQLNLDNLMSQLNDDYIILFRSHYLIADSIDFKKYYNFIYDVSLYDDISNLYVISDILITDYSSAFFDFANLKRPILFYMYDKYEYKNSIRDFYIDLSELPGCIVENENELINKLKNVDNYYNEKYKKFNRKYNYLEDGNASQRVIDKIFKTNN